MKIKIKGEMTIPELRQAIYEQLHEIESRFFIRNTKDITIYMTPTNGFGNQVECRDTNGREVSTLYSDGPYRSAAERYDL